MFSREVSPKNEMFGLEMETICPVGPDIDNIDPLGPDWDLGVPEVSCDNSLFSSREDNEECKDLGLDFVAGELEESYCQNVERNFCDSQESLMTRTLGFSFTNLKEKRDGSLTNNLRFAEDQLLHCLSIVKSFQCQQCGKTFKHRKSLRRHNKNKDMCSEISSGVHYDDKIDDYVKTVKEERFCASETSSDGFPAEPTTKCDICTVQFSSMDKLYIHSDEYTNRRQCCLCKNYPKVPREKQLCEAL